MVVLSQSMNTFGHVSRVMNDGAVVFSDTFEHGPPPEMLDVAVTDDEITWVLYEMESQARVRRYDVGGLLLNESVVAIPGPRRFVTDTAVGFGIMNDAFGVQRLNNEGAATTFLDASPDAAYVLSVDAATAPPAGSILVGRTGADSTSGQLRLQRLSAMGTTGCAEAGLCISLADGACEDDNPCTFGECDPKTGACTQVNMPDGTPCGDGAECDTGACQ